MRSALLSSKKKTISLLNRGAEILVAAETPDDDWEARLGKVPSIYSREINYWLFLAALDILRNRPEIGAALYSHDRLPDAHVAGGGARVRRSISRGWTGF